jgi:hypothetical protein
MERLSRFFTGHHDHRRPTAAKMARKRVEFVWPADDHRTHERGARSQQEVSGKRSGV